MVNTKLFTFLQTFSRHERLQFRKYLVSPFFNENEDLVRLFDLVQDDASLPEKTGKKDQRLGLWRMLFPRKTYDDTRFRRLCSDLLRLAMDFAAYQQYRSNPATEQIFLLHSLASTRLEKHFEGIVRQARHEQDKSGYRDADFHYLEYMLQRRCHEHQEHISPKAATFDFIEKADYHLDCYYLTKKLEHFCDALGYQNMVAGTAEIHLFPGFLEHVESSRYFNEPSVRAWFLAANMMLHREEEHFFQHLKKSLKEEAAFFQKKELQTLFIHLMNYCIDTKINAGRSDYYAELYAIYRIALEQEIIFDNNELNPHHYKNIVTLSLQVKDFEWGEYFIQHYTHRLPKEAQENAHNYNLAHIYFHQGQYEKVIGQLREVEYQTLVYALGSKLLLLRTYYELREYLALDSLIDSFRIYLRRNKLISKEVRQQYMNVLRFTKKLSSVIPYDGKAIEKINAQIEGCKMLAAKKWLLEKAAELK